MKLVNGIHLLLLFLIFCPQAHGRNFNGMTDNFAIYMRGSFDGVASKDTLVSESKGNNIDLDTDLRNKISGEFGVFFASPKLNMRLGVEYIRPLALEDKSGIRSSDGVSMYTAKSDISVLAPKLTVEANLLRDNSSRFFLAAAYGYAMLEARNEYALNDAGRTQFSPVTDFDEQLKGNASLLEGLFGYENVVSDTTTFVIEGGYRLLNFTSISYKKASTNLTGSYIAGQTAINMDGSNRTINLSGVIFSFGFRFWM